MAGSGWVRINEVSNLTMSYTIICGSQIQVTRSADGKVFSWTTNISHIRIFIDMEGPTDLAFITYASAGAGWFDLEGFGQRNLGESIARNASGRAVTDVDELSKLSVDSFEGVDKANAI